MLKKMILCATVAMAALVMFSGVASAGITGTPNLSTIPHTGTDDWTVTSIDPSYGNGTLEVAGGSLLDMDGLQLFLGWGAAPAGNGTVTITGDGSKLLSNSVNNSWGVHVGRNVGEGHVIIEEGGWLESTNPGWTVMISQGGPGTVTVTGDGSKLTSVNGQLVVGMYNDHPGLMTVEDSGLVQTNSIRMGFDGAGEGYIHMGDGGVLAVLGDKTTDPFVSGGLFTKPGGSIGEIQYNPSGDGTTWENMTGATVDVDYTLTYYTSSHTINGQDVNGYTVLQMPLPASELTWQGGTGTWGADPGNWTDGTNPDLVAAASSDMIIDAENDGAEPPVISGPSLVTVDADFVDGGDGPAGSVALGAIGDSTNDAQLKIDVGVTLEVTGATTVAEFGKLISQVQGNDTDVTAEAGVVETDELAIHGADSIQVDWTEGGDATSMFGGVYTIAEYTGTALTDFGESANAAGNIGGAYVKNTEYAVDVNGDGSLYAVEIELHGQGVGDTDLDGVVGPADLADFGLGWSPNASDKTWAEGDFDFNGNVDPADLAAFGLAWAPNGIAFPAETGMGVVPEPGTALMLLIGMAGLLIYRKRR